MLGVLTKLFSPEPDESQACGNERGTGVKPEQPQASPNNGGNTGTSNTSTSPQWLSYYAKIAPEEISRWVNPNDGSGSITYEQLVENLNMVNIPVLPMKPFARPEHFGPRSLPDRDNSTAGSLHEFAPPGVTSDAAPARTAHGIHQDAVRNSMDQRSSGWTPSPKARDSDARNKLPAIVCEEQYPTAAKEGRERPATGYYAAELCARQSLESNDDTGIALETFLAYRRVHDSESTGGERAPNTASRTPEATHPPGTEQALRVPVTSTQAMYIGPVREFRGPLSGVVDGGATRPGPYSQVPPNYVRILNSEVRVQHDREKHALRTAQRSQVIPSRGVGDGDLDPGEPVTASATPLRTSSPSNSPTSEASAYGGANGDTAEFCKNDSPPPRLFHKPPPIFLAPLIEGKDRDFRHSASNRGERQYPALSKGVTFSLGQYVWTAEDVMLGTLRQEKPDLQESVDKVCPGALMPTVFQPESRSADDIGTRTTALKARHTQVLSDSPAKIEDLGLPSVVKLCEEMKAELMQLSGSISKYVRDDLQKVEAEEDVEHLTRGNKGNTGGLRAARCAKKAAVVFVEVPMLKVEMTPEGLWKVFQGLTEDQKMCFAQLEGCAADLSEVEALHCALYCRSVKAARYTGAFQEFFGKMKMNAYALGSGEEWALYPHAARIKHSCNPNVAYRNIDGLLVFFALRDIPEGTPITLSYINQLYMPTEERRKRVFARKHLFCMCTRCLDPMQRERKIFCPHCRPTKLCFEDEKVEYPTVDNSGSVLIARQSGVDHAKSSSVTQQMNSHVLSPDSHQTLNAKEMLKHTPTNEAGAELVDECAKQHVEGEHCNSMHDIKTKDLTNTYSDTSLSSVCSMPDGEDSRQAICDKLCIVSTTIGTTREDTRGKKMEDIGELGYADGDNSDSDASWRDKNSMRENSGISKGFPGRTKDTSLDDENASEITFEAPSASFSDDFTSADSNGNCSSSEFSEEEQEHASKKIADVPVVEEHRCPSLEEKKTNSGVTTEDEGAVKKGPDIYCIYEGKGCWRCGACGRQFTDDDMPVALENYLTGYYTALHERLGHPTPETWNIECGQLIRTVEKVLGAEHWLYMAGHLLLTQLYLGMWTGGLVVDVTLTHALRHAALVVSFMTKPAFSSARQLDVAPLMTAVLRVLLFNGRCREFLEWVEKRGALQVIRETLGTYDEIFISFSSAYAYVRRKVSDGSEPSLSLLHRFAHASQRTIAQNAAYYDKKEAENKEKVARLKAAMTKETLNRQETLREPKIHSLTKSIAALKATAASSKLKQVRDVTLTSPESIVGQFLKKYAAPGASAHIISEALQGLRGPYGNDKSSTGTSNNVYLMAAAAYKQARRIQQMAIDGGLPAGFNLWGLSPEQAYLPLIMLADPLEASAQQRRVVHASADAVKRERRRYEELKQALRCSTIRSGRALPDSKCRPHSEKDEGSDVACEASTQPPATHEGETPVYKVPGLSDTAPGEFVTISHINHTKDGSYPPIPFFRTFFYVDHEASNVVRGAAEEKQLGVNIRVLGCGAEGVAALSKEELDDLEAARHNFLHHEAERLNSEARTTLVLEMGRRAQEAAGTMRSTEALEGKRDPSDEVISTVDPIDTVQEVNRALREVVIRDAHTLQRIEDYRESRSSDNAEACESICMRGRKEISDGERQGDPPQRAAEPSALPTSTLQPPAAGDSSPATGHNGSAVAFSGSATPKRRLRMRCELKNVPECFVGPQPVHKSVSLESSNLVPYENGSEVTTAQDQMTHYDLKATGYAHRFLKPLDFSHVPPPPVLPACARFPTVALHSHYKLARDIGRIACQNSQLRPPRPVVAEGQKATFSVPPVPPARPPEASTGPNGKTCPMLTKCAEAEGVM